MKKENRNPVGLYTIGIVGLFLAGFFLLVIFGAHSYQSTVHSQDDNREDRAVLAYITTCIRDNDSSGAVSIYRGEEGYILSIDDGETGYALRIYLRDGFLVEDLGKSGSQLDPDSMEIIAECSSFYPELVRPDLLKVTTDRGQDLIYLRSEERSGQ